MQKKARIHTKVNVGTDVDVRASEKIGITIVSAIIICGSVLFISCNRVQIYPGRIEIVERSFDYSLQDSAAIHGYVLEAYEEKPTLSCRSTILIVETGATTQDNDSGYFFIKLLPGTYTVERFFTFPTWNDTMRLENLKILPNEKVKIKFFRRIEIR